MSNAPRNQLAPLTNVEKSLLRLAEDQAWSKPLREALAFAVKARGGQVRYHDNCGDLADDLRRMASA